jgi:hypothetical protein
LELTARSSSNWADGSCIRDRSCLRQAPRKCAGGHQRGFSAGAAVPEAVDKIRKACVGRLEHAAIDNRPGMGVFTCDTRVLDSPMTIKNALVLIVVGSE